MSNSWQKLLRIFYQYTAEVLLYVEGGKLKGLVSRQDFSEDLSDLGSISPSLDSFVTKIKDIDEALAHLEKSQAEQAGKKVIPAVNKEFDLIGLWSRLEIIQAWEDLPSVPSPSVKKWHPQKEGVKPDQGGSKEIHHEEKKQISLNQKLAMLAMEALPIGMLALDTLGNQLFYNEDWLALKKKHPRILTTKRILQSAKEMMAREAHKTAMNLNATFILNDIIQDDILKMRLIRDKNSTIGYLFWYPEAIMKRASKTSHKDTETYEGKSLKKILADKEKQILAWAMDKAKGKISEAAKILGVPRQTFAYRYEKHRKSK